MCCISKGILSLLGFLLLALVPKQAVHQGLEPVSLVPIAWRLLQCLHIIGINKHLSKEWREDGQKGEGT